MSPEDREVTRQRPAAVLRAPRVVEINANVVLTGSLGRPGTRPVHLQVLDTMYDVWKRVARTRSTRAGDFRFAKVLVRPPANPAPILTVRAFAPRAGSRPAVATPRKVVRSVYPRPDMTGPLTIASVDSDERLGDERSGDNGFDLSDDGRFAVFASAATWADPSQRRPGLQIFLRDRERGRTTLITRGLDGRPTNYSFTPLISGDGRWVVYWSKARKLVAHDPTRSGDLYWWDRRSGRNSVVVGVPRGAYVVRPLALSRDGRFLAFATSAPDISPSPVDEAMDLYVLDRETGEADQVPTPDTPRGYGIEDMFAVSMSDDGRFIAYAVDVPDLSPSMYPNNRELRLTDRRLGTTQEIPVDPFGLRGPVEDVDVTHTAMSGDGRFVAYVARIVPSEPSRSARAAVVWDRQTGDVEVVAQPPRPYPDPNAGPAVADISSDGRYVAYLSIDVIDEQVLRADRVTGIVDVVVPDPPVGPPDGSDPFFSAPRISGDGSTIVFTIDALQKEYVPGDINRVVDLFAWDAPPAD